MKKYIVFVGNFGSGKSELALNHAVSMAKSGPSTLVDLDIVNPYFRSSERAKFLEAAGVELIAPPFAQHKIEIMSLSPRVFSIFTPGEGSVVIDAGGDPIGAVALGQYHSRFMSLPPGALECWMVVNPFRPLADTPEKAAGLMQQIELASRLQVTGLINNANLGAETTAQMLLQGYETVAQMAQHTGLPVTATAGTASILRGFEQLAEEQGCDPRLMGQPMEIDILMHRSWEKFLKEGL